MDPVLITLLSVALALAGFHLGWTIRGYLDERQDDEHWERAMKQFADRPLFRSPRRKLITPTNTANPGGDANK